jgi:mRNA-degrading endonuclease HigB of HigAB toxin-antitoxin module
MRVITYKAIEQYSEMHAAAKIALDDWYIITEHSEWDCFTDMKLIANKSEYEANMARVNELVELVDDNTPKNDRNYIELDFLTDLVVTYEKLIFR